MIPDVITREHVLLAMERVDREGVPPSRARRTFDVRYQGRVYPPKLVISLSCEVATGTPLSPLVFTGGPEANGFLRRLGFEVVDKRTGASSRVSRGTPGTRQRGNGSADHGLSLEGLARDLVETREAHGHGEGGRGQEVP